MTFWTNFQNKDGGFTLIEVLLCLIIASVLGTMMYSYFSMVVVNGVLPVARIQKSFDLNRVMENITANYYSTVKESGVPDKWQPMTSYAANTDAVVSKSQRYGHIYQCVKPGISGNSEPQWPTGAGSVIEDGEVLWKTLDGQLDGLVADISAIENEGAGKYSIAILTFIRFDDNGREYAVEPNEPENILKVRIKNEVSETLTALFTTTY